MASNGSRSGGAAGSGGPKTPKRGAATKRRSPRRAPKRSDDTPAVERGDDNAVGAAGDPDALIEANDEDLKKLEAARRAKVIKAAIIGLVAVALITFVLQNARPVEIHLLLWTVSMRLIWVVVVAVALGAFGGYLVGKPDKNVRLHGPRRRREDAPAD